MISIPYCTPLYCANKSSARAIVDWCMKNDYFFAFQYNRPLKKYVIMVSEALDLSRIPSQNFTVQETTP